MPKPSQQIPCIAAKAQSSKNPPGAIGACLPPHRRLAPGGPNFCPEMRDGVLFFFDSLGDYQWHGR